MESELIPGTFYIYKVGGKENTGKELYSTMFVTDDKKEYEVVFTRHDVANPTPAWYLVEKTPTIQEAEIVETTAEEPFNDTLQIQVNDELDVQALFGGGDGKENAQN